ncbi:hypothetical protein [Cysteiniphilum sp. 6C5]|uniref:hypothetical protein n=1 Tax=unclassified Cysteiniphilum TaxID=2610889 RepID=UPI003F8467BC
MQDNYRNDEHSEEDVSGMQNVSIKTRLHCFFLRAMRIGMVIVFAFIGAVIGYWLKQYCIEHLPFAAMFIGFASFTALTVIGAFIGNRLGLAFLDRYHLEN